ncbi:hypothetical protein vseg_011638 [Gypsophila vaccaria]
MVELSENEIKNFIKVWLTILVSLTYCYIIGKFTPKGFTRLLAILPIITLFFTLPLNFTSIHLCGLTSFFITWLANLKLLLFAFGKPPLGSDPSLSFLYFVSVSCLPIKIQNDPTQTGPPESLNKQDPCHKTASKSPWNYIIKGSLLAIILKAYDFNDLIPEKLLRTLYGFHIYFALEIILACVAKAANCFLGFELEPQFNEPLLSTSLQDFWGRRWNLMVTSILRPTVYLPTSKLCTKFVGRETAKLVAVMATFVVSAMYHELIFYYLGRVAPTFQVTWFFILHGFCLCAELAVKRHFGRTLRVPRSLSVAATIGFVVATGLWLFMPPLLRAGLASKGLHEYAVVGAFVKRLVKV